MKLLALRGLVRFVGCLAGVAFNRHFFLLPLAGVAFIRTATQPNLTLPPWRRMASLSFTPLSPWSFLDHGAFSGGLQEQEQWLHDLNHN